jgi:hypothetical protein
MGEVRQRHRATAIVKPQLGSDWEEEDSSLKQNAQPWTQNEINHKPVK